MSISRAGLKQIVATDAGALSTGTNATAIGLRNAAIMEISNFKQVTDYLERNLRNMKNFKIEGESLQPTIKMLKNMISFLNLGCDLQAVTRPQSAGGSGDVYQFTGDNKPGLDLEYMISSDKRSLKAIWEIAMEYARAQTLIDGADSATAETFSGITGEGADFTAYHAPYYLAFESPKTTAALTSKGDIKERSYSIKTKNKKSIYNASIVDFLMFEFKIVAYESSVAKQIEIMSKDMSPSIYVKEQNASESLFDCFDFAAGVLSLSEVHTNNDDERTIEMTFSGNAHIYDITWDLTATGGGEVDGDGSKGGAMKIGY